MAWQIEYTRTAEKQLRKLGAGIALRIANYMDDRIATAKDPRTSGKALVGPMTGLWRYRVGDHRIIVDIRDKEIIILVVEIGDRKDIYR